jgi:glycosyltransferase involved in cell wall biosynthesis
VVVSQHTASALNVWFDEASARKFPVFYSPSTVRNLQLPSDSFDSGKYILMVSGNRWEKNVLRAIMAFEQLFDKGLLEDVHVNITGLKSYNQLRYRFRHPERFHLLGYVSDSDLGRLYRDAYAFVYPSVNEGFGYPPLEAMNCRVPVAASAVASIPEVCGDAVLYFNPFDVAEIANRILRLTDDATRKHLIDAGAERYAKIKERQDHDLDALIDYICRD